MPEPVLNVLAITRAYLETHGFAGLTAPDCGCGLTDLAPCGDGPYRDCCAAHARVLGPDEHVGNCGSGATLYFSPQENKP